MSSFGVVAIGDVLEMLKQCAPGSDPTPTEHYYCIKFNGRTYPSLPLGEHGPKRAKLRSEVKVGDVRKMIRFLGIDKACCHKAIPRLAQ